MHMLQDAHANVSINGLKLHLRHSVLLLSL
jgi:hypothetical protein